MTHELLVLTISALSIGFFHTLFGPDHYLPFVLISKARNWTTGKTAWVTFLCGVGHIGSSVFIGLGGIALGLAVSKLEFIESIRGNLAAWLLIGFGLAYMIWGLRKAYRDKPHTHFHVHGTESEHTHVHTHHHDHLHVHEPEKAKNLTPWILFTIFVFGPCEPLIPLLMYPAASGSYVGLMWIVLVFSTVTILTMISSVLLLRSGLVLLPMKKIERYTHAIAGATILICGLSIQLLGL